MNKHALKTHLIIFLTTKNYIKLHQVPCAYKSPLTPLNFVLSHSNIHNIITNMSITNFFVLLLGVVLLSTPSSASIEQESQPQQVLVIQVDDKTLAKERATPVIHTDAKVPSAFIRDIEHEILLARKVEPLAKDRATPVTHAKVPTSFIRDIEHQILLGRKLGLGNLFVAPSPWSARKASDSQSQKHRKHKKHAHAPAPAPVPGSF